nr:hypothetical protein [uncultured Aminipila sp.]
MDNKKGLSLNQSKRKIIIVFLILLLCLLAVLYVINMKPKDFSKQPGYNQLLENAIIAKNAEMQKDREKAKAEGSDWFMVPKEMDKDPRYHNSDGTLNMDMVCEELGISADSPQGATKETQLSSEDKAIKPHVLEGTEIAIYSDENKKLWRLNKGDVIKFHVFVDTEYYNNVGALYFGALKDEEPFLIDNLDIDNSVDVTSEHEFEYTATESGNYHFYLFRGSNEPIIIKWIDISRS